MRFKVLGPLGVTGSEGIVSLGGPKQRAVLAHLLVRANELVPADALIDQVWTGEPPAAARGTIHSYISHLRKALGPDRIEGRAPGYVLHVGPDELDAARFEQLLGEARLMNGSPGRAGTLLREALALWTGPAFADLSSEPSLAGEIARLDELRLQALEERTAADLAEGRHGEVIGELESLTSELPLRERLWELLMLALYRARRPADALAAFERARDLLARELGVDPSADLRRLHERILREDPALDLEGEPLRGYRLLDQVGEGAFGVVYRAIQPQVGREVAIKAVHPELANHPDFVRRFEHEAQIVARLEHPHIVPLYDYWREPDAAYLVMRYLRGGSVEGLLEAGPVEPSRVASIVDQIASALAAAHRQGVVHRDVKPGNILLDEEGNAYLTDFGVALDVGSPERSSGTMMRGTPAYLSPEQIRLDPASPRSDIYALGIVVYEMLTGKHPFPETSLTALLDRHVHDALPSARDVRPQLPRGVDDMIARSTAKDPSQRFSDVVEVASELRSAIEGTRVAHEPIGETRNPYKGLRAFLEADAGDFFGREAVTKRLIRSLAEDDPAARFLAVVGPSGSGKSSVVRAGLVPALRRGVIPGSERWYVIEVLPGQHPMREIEAALLGVAVEPPPSLMEVLERDELGLVRVVDRVLPDPDGELVIVVDQLEEVFTLVNDDLERSHLLGSLRAAALEPESRVRIVTTLRADFYDAPLSVPGFGDLLAARTEAITPMSPEELERAIVAPADRAGLGVEPRLLAEMIADVADHPGALPLLQYALTELAERATDGALSLDAYRRIGRISGALARRAEQLFEPMNADAGEACRQLFLRLVTLGEGVEDTRRRVRRSELATLAEASAMDAVIETYGRHRLLSFDRDPDTREPTVEIAHEALLSAWGRLRTWIDDAREDLRHERGLARAAAEWRGSDGDKSFLVRGARLEQLETWAATTDLAIGRSERAYLKASVDHRDREWEQEERRREREARIERRSARRLRGLVAIFAAAAVIAGTLTVVATNQSGKAGREASRAAIEARTATARELAAAAVANLDGDPELSVLLASEAVQTTRSIDGTVLPEAEEALHRAVVASRLELEVPGVGGSLAWSPAGTFVTEGPENTGVIDIRDGETGESVLSFHGHDVDVNDVAFSSDGSRLASTGDDGKLKVWDPSNGRLISTVSGDGRVWGPSFGADDSLVAAAWLDEGVVRVLDLSTDRVVSTVRVRGPNDTALSPDGRSLAVATDSCCGEVGDVDDAVFDVRTGEERFPLRAPDCCNGPSYRGVSWSPDGRYVAAGSEDATRVWDAETGRLRHTLLGQTGFVRGVAWSPDSSRLVTGGSDGTATVWAIRATRVRELWSLPAQETTSAIWGVAFSPDGTRVMAGDSDISVVKIWDLGPTGDAEVANLPAPAAFKVEFMPDGRRLVTSRRFARAVTIWDLRTGRDLRTIGPASDHFWFQSFDVSPDGSSIALGGGSKSNGFGGAAAVRAWETSTGEELFRIGHELDVNDVSYSPDGDYLVTASWDGTAKIIDRAGRVLRVLEERGFSLFYARFSPDGRLVATMANTEDFAEGHVTVWDWERDEVVRSFNDVLGGVAFDPTGPRIAMVGPKGLVEIRDVESGSRLAVLHGPSGGVFGIAFSPDGSRVAVPHVDGTVRLFEADTGAQRLVLPGFGCPVSWVAFSPDGTKLASASKCGGLRIWALDIGDLLEIAHREVPRALTDEECRQYLHVNQCLQA